MPNRLTTASHLRRFMRDIKLDDAGREQLSGIVEHAVLDGITWGITHAPALTASAAMPAKERPARRKVETEWRETAARRIARGGR